MLVKPTLESLLPKVENRYTLAILVAKRARQLVDGAQPMVVTDSPNLVTLACEELAADKVVGVKGHLSPTVPLRPEIEAEILAAKAAAEEASMAEAVKVALDQAADVNEKQADDESDIQIISENILTLDDQVLEDSEAIAEQDLAQADPEASEATAEAEESAEEEDPGETEDAISDEAEDED